MAFFALLWKARTIENYRLNYEKEKINSIVLGNTQLEQTLSQRWRHYRFDTKKRISRIFKKWYPDGSVVSNFFLYLMTDQTFPNFLLKSVMGFVGGIILTYLCFMFFVFQLAISLIHATIMSSIIGVLLTLGLAFSYRIRCLVFLLIPQFFSRVGRYTLTCYALVLILTGPATNTLKNSEVLSESMACSQEQIKTSVHQLNDLMKKPINAMKDSLKPMVDQLKMITAKVKETVIRLNRLVLSIVNVIQSSFSWLQSVADICNAKLGTPYERCCNAILDGFSHCQKTLDPRVSMLCNVAYVAQAACYSVKPFKAFCYATDFMDEAILASVKKKLRNLTEHLRAMFHVEVHVHHSYSYSSNSSRSASQVAAGIVTEIRNRADPLLTWLSWSSCVTSLFLLLIIFRAKYYQHMYETRSRFDNRYVTMELQELDLKRQQQGRETILPLNRRERAKYITTSSFRLVASEKVYLNRSAVFMAITTFKLLIHMVADYSLYWVLMTIRYHGRLQSDLIPGIPHSGAHVSGSGFVARLFNSIVGILDIPVSFPAPSPISCLPDPYPPDLRRYTQIGVLIFLLWFFALFEPYGLRLRHLIMGHYRPERAKARATWLYNHILRTRGSFMKFARRKLHRDYKYSSETSLTFRQWITHHVPCQTADCPGVFCISCFSDIGELCTICLSPADYGDLSDVSFEKGSSDDSDSDVELSEGRMNEIIKLHSTTECDRSVKSTRSKDENRRWSYFTETTGPRGPLDTIALLHTGSYINKPTIFSTFFKKRFQNMKRNLKKRCRDKKHTLDWLAKLTPENMFKDFCKEENLNFYSNLHDIEEYGEFDEVITRKKSIGVNTDRNRSVLLNILVKSFPRRKLQQPRGKKKKSKSELKRYKKLQMRRINENTNTESTKKTLFSTKSFQVHNLTTGQRNLKSVVRGKKYSRTKDKMKRYEEHKGIMKAIRYFRKSNEIKNMSNQNNCNNSPIENSKKISKPSDNSNAGGKKNKNKCSKANQPKRPSKQKDVSKVKTKNSRHRISEFHKFFSNHWNNFKSSIMPGNARIRTDIPNIKETRNHKRRKKRKLGDDLNETDMGVCFARKDKDIKHTRNLRISAFLAELEWTKKDYSKDKERDSFLQLQEVPAPINTNKVVGMVQLKNLPFQWHEVRKRDFFNRKEKKYICAGKQSPTSSKQKIYVKKALERFRNKVKSVPESPTSLVHRIMNTMSDERCETPINPESSICISKRASLFYQPFARAWTQHSDFLDTDVLFKNTKFSNMMVQEPCEETPSSIEGVSSNFVSCLGKEIFLSCNSTNIQKPNTNRRCNCVVYEDLQRKWAHVKKSLAELQGKKNPLSMVKNFCSTLFEQSCTLKTCPNRPEKGTREPRKNYRKSQVKTRNCHTQCTQECVNRASQSPTQNEGDIQVRQMCTHCHKLCKKTKKESLAKRGSQNKKDTETQKIRRTDVKEKKDKEAKRGGQNEEDTETERTSNTEIKDKKEKEAKGGYPNKKEIETQLSSGTEVKEKEEKEAIEGCPCSQVETLLKQCLMNKNKKKEEEMKEKAGTVETASSPFQLCKNVICDTHETQHDSEDATDSKMAGKRTKAVGSFNCFCDEAVQIIPHHLCTCATQHVSSIKLSNVKTRPDTKTVNENKKTQHEGADEAVQIIPHHLCTCATQHVSSIKLSNVKTRPDTKTVNENKKTQHEGADEAVQIIPHHLCTCATQHVSCIQLSNVKTRPDTKTVNENKKTQHEGADEAVQIIPHHLCTCATQHVSCIQLSNVKTRPDTKTVNENKKTRHKGAVMADKRTDCNFRKHHRKNGLNVAQALKNELIDYTISEISDSSISLRSDGSRTDTTICSLATMNYDNTPRRRKIRVKVVTKINQATLTDKARVCDTGTVTQDWWSPIVERKANEEIVLEKKKGFNVIEQQKEKSSEVKERKDILLEKKKGFNVIEQQKEKSREVKERKDLREVRKRRKNYLMTADDKNVTFRSSTFIIPSGLFPRTKDIMSPSRYLLESQKYYNELFAYNYPRPCPQAVYNYVPQMPMHHEKEKSRSHLGSRRNHHRKTKRLDECYSPRRQVGPAEDKSSRDFGPGCLQENVKLNLREHQIHLVGNLVIDMIDNQILITDIMIKLALPENEYK